MKRPVEVKKKFKISDRYVKDKWNDHVSGVRSAFLMNNWDEPENYLDNYWNIN